VHIREKTSADGERLTALWTAHFGAPHVVSRGREHRPLLLPGFVAEEGGALLGAVTFQRTGDELEIVTLDSQSEDHGVGTALLATIVSQAHARGIVRLWLVTTNDNMRALRFSQRRGWSICALHVNAVDAARKLKPEIPLTGDHEIPIRHEIEFEFRLD
jgi:GNAT superfamily N-acetyltransferase